VQAIIDLWGPKDSKKCLGVEKVIGRPSTTSANEENQGRNHQDKSIRFDLGPYPRTDHKQLVKKLLIGTLGERGKLGRSLRARAPGGFAGKTAKWNILEEGKTVFANGLVRRTSTSARRKLSKKLQN